MPGVPHKGPSKKNKKNKISAFDPGFSELPDFIASSLPSFQGALHPAIFEQPFREPVRSKIHPL
jgi:hypothetical protein